LGKFPIKNISLEHWIDSSILPCYPIIMKTKLTHVAWDFGIIQRTAIEILGYTPGQKTTKTLCKRRVKMERINNTKPTCPECMEILKRDPNYGENTNQ